MKALMIVVIAAGLSAAPVAFGQGLQGLRHRKVLRDEAQGLINTDNADISSAVLSRWDRTDDQIREPRLPRPMPPLNPPGGDWALVTI